MDPSPATEQTSGGGGGGDAHQWRRRHNEARRARLSAEVGRILRASQVPLRDVIRDHAVPRLPAQSLLRFRSVSAEWNRLISAPIFAHTQSHTHRSASGVFYQSPPAGGPGYSPFDPLAGSVPDPSLTFLPRSPHVAVLASSNGLLCCGSILDSYYICNPSTAEWTALPKPPLPSIRRHLDDSATVALIFEPSAGNLDAGYRLIRAYEIHPDCPGIYGFKVFSSETGEWEPSPGICVVERLVPGSGVSAGGAAYWRSSMQEVVAYDPASYASRTVPWPMGYDASAWWELGEMAGRICCTCVTEAAVEVYELGPSDRWPY